MKVFKFGGGTLKSAASIRLMTQIVRQEGSGVVVVSAFNKMTNSLEKLLEFGSGEDRDAAIQRIFAYHRGLAAELLKNPDVSWEPHSRRFEAELNSSLKDFEQRGYDLYYDQVVCFGELMSSALVSVYWEEVGLVHHLVDAREVIVTDSSYRAARVKWDLTGEKARLFFSGSSELYLTQGFIGSDGEGLSTTLGREGSDYTAAILANLTGASEVVVWKDVPGIMTADPAEFDGATKMDEVSYLEAVELSYFGAKVIHPNTIKPLHNKNIPLIVKSLFHPEESGTRVFSEAEAGIRKPVIIRMTNQVLVSLQPRDFSFIFEDAVARVFSLLFRHRIRINLVQHGAVSISLVFDWDQERLDDIMSELLSEFKILYNSGLELWTIRHYDEETVDRITRGKKIYVEQKSRQTARFVIG